MPRPGVGFFGGHSSAPVLEIKPDSPFVVFYGPPSEAQDAELKGKLVLSNAESMSVRSIRMTLTGVRKVSWYTANTVTPQPISHKQHFLIENLTLFPVTGAHTKSHKINAGTHEWDFKFKMPSSLDESVEGLPTNYIIYNLKASVDRGYMSKPLLATSHIRVIRTLARDLMETVPMEQLNEDIWASKIAYKITVPQKNYIVGTHITADFVLIPLRKGVEISNIKMELIESRQLFCEFAGRRVSHQAESQVCCIDSKMPDNSMQLVPDGVDDADSLFDECHRFSKTLDLPKSLKNCRQSIDTENIRVSHKLRIYVNLLNPEGHTSQLLVKNHVNLFISPNLPPGEDQSVVVDEAVLSQQVIQDEVNQNAPPTYGLHQLDELYNGIDPSGFMTPGGHASIANSGANTPFYAHSRSGSAENLASLDAALGSSSLGSSYSNSHGGGVSTVALQHRLANLNLNQLRNNSSSRFNPSRQHSTHGDRTPPGTGGSYFANATLGSSSYDMEALTRTPSYNTAVRTPAAQTPLSEDVPSYDVATSRPSSPSRSGNVSGSASADSSRGGTPSPRRLSRRTSLDTLFEETRRNTALNGGLSSRE
ncbi:carbon catabolite repression protein cred [Periconia macrospinosa]|uniref:Carbon catabolite repression protein cred n=1 Tax=Periconia macrospinosa TaxID=97972 RepID=A0A2V1DDD5_9PLEO|nr:carbon catabolite repression protein cred [Periconia macrospinosa]